MSGAEHEPGGPGDERLPIRYYVPEDMEAGAYAQTVAVWHTPYDFTFDFAAMQFPQSDDPDEPTSFTLARVVSRVRVPAGFVFDVLRMISAEMETYEARWGEIRRPERREREP